MLAPFQASACPKRLNGSSRFNGAVCTLNLTIPSGSFKQNLEPFEGFYKGKADFRHLYHAKRALDAIFASTIDQICTLDDERKLDMFCFSVCRFLRRLRRVEGDEEEKVNHLTALRLARTLWFMLRLQVCRDQSTDLQVAMERSAQTMITIITLDETS